MFVCVCVPEPGLYGLEWMLLVAEQANLWLYDKALPDF